MCNAACLEFVEAHLLERDVRGRRILEVGAYDTTGSVRPYVEGLGPAEYIGIDIQPGPRVDIVCDVRHLLTRFGSESFDIVISTEVIEHVRDWRSAINNMRGVLRHDGVLLLTTRSLGFPFHYGPFDYWRYEPDDLMTIFSRDKIEAMDRDPISPGVFARVRRREGSVDLDNLMLYSMVREQRIQDVSDIDVLLFRLSDLRRAAHWLLPESLRRWLGRFVVRAGGG